MNVWFNRLCLLVLFRIGQSTWLFLIHRKFFLSGDICQCRETFLNVTIFGWESTIGIHWVETRDAATYPTMHRIAPCNRELPRVKCQKCQDWKICSNYFFFSLLSAQYFYVNRSRTLENLDFLRIQILISIFSFWQGRSAYSLFPS